MTAGVRLNCACAHLTQRLSITNVSIYFRGRIELCGEIEEVSEQAGEQRSAPGVSKNCSFLIRSLFRFLLVLSWKRLRLRKLGLLEKQIPDTDLC